MISEQAFNHGMTLLFKRFREKLDPDIAKLWGTYLNAQLTEEQFIYAVELATLKNRFFPTAEELIEFALGSAETRAAGEWEICLKAARRGQSIATLTVSFAAMDAIASVGGLAELGRCEEGDLPWKRKEFIAAWKSWTPAARKSLPADVGPCEVPSARDVHQAAAADLRSLPVPPKPFGTANGLPIAN